MMVCSITRSKVKVKVTSLQKLEIISFSKATSSAIYNGSWQSAICKFVQTGFLIFILVFLSRDFELGRNVSCEESTVSPYGANLLIH